MTALLRLQSVPCGCTTAHVFPAVAVTHEPLASQTFFTSPPPIHDPTSSSVAYIRCYIHCPTIHTVHRP